jgi:hypothetical protein
VENMPTTELDLIDLGRDQYYKKQIGFVCMPVILSLILQ